jgi:hypothetical protein
MGFLFPLVLALATATAGQDFEPSGFRPGASFPAEGVFLCRASNDVKPVPDEVPPTMRIEYSKVRAWVKVTVGTTTFEKTWDSLRYGPMSWGGDFEKHGWSVNVAPVERRHRWSWFSMSAERVDWKGHCQLNE